MYYFYLFFNKKKKKGNKILIIKKIVKTKMMMYFKIQNDQPRITWNALNDRAFTIGVISMGRLK